MGRADGGRARAVTILCSFVGGETGRLLEPLLDDLPGERLLTRTAAASGSYVADRRDGDRRTVVVTRGERPAVVYAEGDVVRELVPPRFARGWREGCGDTMMGAVAGGWADDLPLLEALRWGAAAGAANFLRHGLGTGARRVVEDLAAQVEIRPRAVSGCPAA